MRIILASTSKRRKRILDQINLEFLIMDSKINEEKLKINKKQPHLYTIKMAEAKAKAISIKHHNDLVVGADTIVCVKGEILEKPKNKQQALSYLKKLSNNTHYVYTGVNILCKNKNINISFYEKTLITFYKLSLNDINYYIEYYKPFDKAGAYGIQDWSCIFAKNIRGCFYNIVGFPIAKFYNLMNTNNIKLNFNAKR